MKSGGEFQRNAESLGDVGQSGKMREDYFEVVISRVEMSSMMGSGQTVTRQRRSLKVGHCVASIKIGLVKNE